MTDPICQLMEDIEDLCKRCYYLQKSNNEMYDYLKDDGLLEEYITENEKIIEKYHRKINEMFQLLKDNSEKEIQWSPIAMDYKQKEDEEKKLCDEKKRKLTIQNPTNQSDDKGVFL